MYNQLVIQVLLWVVVMVVVVLVKMAIVVINQNDLYWIMLLQHKYFIKLAVSTKNNSILTFDKIYILL